MVNFKRYYNLWLIITLTAVLAVVITACSPQSSATPSSTAGQAVKLVFITQPEGAVAGEAFAVQPVVAALDANGNIVTAYRNVASLAISGDTGAADVTLFGATKVTSEKGYFNFKDLIINQAGTYKLTAASGGLTPAVSNPFVIHSSSGIRLAFSKPVAGAPAGTALAAQPVVTVVDIYGNKVTDSTAEVSLSVITADSGITGAFLYGNSRAKAVNGVATFEGLWINKVGIFAIIATISGVTSTFSNSFEITPGAAVKLFFSTQPQESEAGKPLTIDPPTIAVVIRDNFDNTVRGSNIEVTLSITPGTGAAGAVLSGVTKLKTDIGVVNFGEISIDKPGKGYTLTATAGGLVSAVSESFDIIPASTQAVSK